MMTILLWIYFGSAMTAFVIDVYDHMTSYRPKFPLWMNLMCCLIPIFNSIFALGCIYETIKQLVNRVTINEYRLIHACETCKFCDHPAPEVRGGHYYTCKLRSTIGIDIIVEPTELCNEWVYLDAVRCPCHDITEYTAQKK